MPTISRSKSSPKPPPTGVRDNAAEIECRRGRGSPDDVETEEKGITVGEQVDETKVLAILSLEWQEMLRMRSRVCNGLANCMEQMCGVALSPNAEKWYALRRELIRTDLKISQEAMKLFFATGVILLSNLRGQAHQTMREVIGIRLVAVDALNRLLLQKQLKNRISV